MAALMLFDFVMSSYRGSATAVYTRDLKRLFRVLAFDPLRELPALRLKERQYVLTQLDKDKKILGYP